CSLLCPQACYGILKVPIGSWLCRTCALGVQPKCLLCPKRGGALKPTRSGTKWVHVSCALWIPEVSIGCPEKMEPITKISHIPASRWALSCSLCKECTGTCIQ
ncbi:JADE2 ligase, partial [Neodrepanis coruscans]|nr:JADE2 ligase [Neodrepanis coruscans]